MKESIVGYTGSGFGFLVSAVQTNQVLQIILVVLSILEVIITTAFVIYKWYKKATEDGKITVDEVKEAVDIVDKAIQDTKDIISKTDEKDE